MDEALQKATLHAEMTGSGRERLHLTLTNQTSEPFRISVPAGQIFRGSTGERVITLRLAEFLIPPAVSINAEIPAAALSARNGGEMRSFTATNDSEPKLAPFLSFLATQDDLPRVTSQLVILALLEDISFAQWQQFLTLETGINGKAPGNVRTAIDALGLLKELHPNGTFALAEDTELKLRALRNPVTRAKAVQIYGIALPDEPTSPKGEVPRLKQLLHTQPGDNCPTCRMRKQSGRGAGDF